MPILKAKTGELWALERCAHLDGSHVLPLLELVPDNDKGGEAERFIRVLGTHLAAGTVVAVDTTYLRAARNVNGVSPLRWIADQLAARQIVTIPVVRALSSPAQFADAAYVCARQRAGAMLRLGDDTNTPTLLGSGLLRSITAAVGIPLPDLDVLFDFRAVATTTDVKTVAPAATAALAWGTSLGARSVTLAAGAFPKVISSMPLGTCTVIDRHDAHLWSATNLPCDFGDYAVNHPSMSDNQWGRSKPNLRYTADSTWKVWREDTNNLGYPDNKGFFVLCQKVIYDPSYAGIHHCDGDVQIDRCAHAPGTAASGQGGATQWRAYGTSHHIQTVVSRLATLGVP